MSVRVVPPSLSLSARLSLDDQAVLAALAEQNGVTMAEVIRWGVRWYAIEGPYGLDGHPDNDNLRAYCLGAGVGPARYELPDPADRPAPEVDNLRSEWTGGARVK